MGQRRKMSRKKLFELRMRFGMVFRVRAVRFSHVSENVGFAIREHTDKPDEEVTQNLR